MLQETGDSTVDIAAIGDDDIEGRTGDEAPLNAGMLGADAVVVGIEQHAESQIKGTKICFKAFKDKGFEEPCGVGQMPFDRARIGHGLNGAILGREWRGECQ